MSKLRRTILMLITGLLLAGVVFVPLSVQAREIYSYSQRPILSALGDSITSYYTYSIHENSYYGPKDTPAVYNMDEADTWWSVYAMRGGIN